MRASEISFRRMLIYAAGNLNLAEPTSFMQVEHGIKELEACWQGFVDTSDRANLEFKNKSHVCNEFATLLTDYIICDEQSSPESLGFTVFAGH